MILPLHVAGVDCIASSRCVGRIVHMEDAIDALHKARRCCITNSCYGSAMLTDHTSRSHRFVRYRSEISEVRRPSIDIEHFSHGRTMVMTQTSLHCSMKALRISCATKFVLSHIPSLVQI